MRIIIRSGNKYFRAGKVTLSAKGEVFYEPPLELKSTLSEEIFVHVAWHASGSVLLKIKTSAGDIRHIPIENGVGFVKDPGERQEIVGVGFQVLFYLRIPGVIFLSECDELRVKDLVLDLNGYLGAFVFATSLVSGTCIVDGISNIESSVRMVDGIQNPNRLDSKFGCLGRISGNADKLVQFHLEKLKFQLPSGKCELIIPSDSAISKVIL